MSKTIKLKIDTVLMYVSRKRKEKIHTLSSFKLLKAPRHSTKNAKWRSISVP